MGLEHARLKFVPVTREVLAIVEHGISEPEKRVPAPALGAAPRSSKANSATGWTSGEFPDSHVLHFCYRFC